MTSLIINIDNTKYLIEIEKVERIEQRGVITSVPGSKDYIAGIRDYSNSVLSIVDFRLLLGMQLLEQNLSSQRILVINHNDRKFGLLVDDVDEIVDIDESNIVGEDKEDNNIFSLNKAIELDGQIILMIEFKDDFMCQDF
jgi:purine-binding chemotaxis protein CheW